MFDHNDDTLGDFEIEISDLDRTGDSSAQRHPPKLRWMRRQRGVSLAVTAALFVLVCALLLAGTPDVRGLVARLVAGPGQIASSSGLRLYLESNPSWGEFQLDGATLAHLPLIGQD
ncbi:MAG TPA: hypothetical protein VF458_10105, partial [Ktedonobacteraceae bacterium]